MPVLEPVAEAGMEPYGEAKGLLLAPGVGAGSIESFSNEAGRGVLEAVVAAVPWRLSMLDYCASCAHTEEE